MIPFSQGVLTQSTVISSSNQMIILLVVSIILGIFFMYIIRKSIVNQIKEVMDAAFKLADGNFNLQMSAESKDEINTTTAKSQEGLRMAINIPLNTNMKNYEVAIACGYSTPAYFSTVFKGMCGVTPSEYRQKYMQNEDISE